MRKDVRSLVGPSLAMVLLGLSAAQLPAASPEPAPSQAPVNPEWTQYLQESIKRAVLTTADGHPLGHVPAPVDLSHAKGAQVFPPGFALQSLPTSYDLRTITNKLPPVRNQGQCGDCWAFATYGSLESCLRPGETGWDFSEMDLNCSHGFDYASCVGGNSKMATAFLARWDGPVTDSCYPSGGTTCTSPRPGCPVQKHIQEVIFLPARGSSLDNDNIKNAVMTYGGVDTSMYWSDASYNSGTYSYYYSGTGSNHDVCIVGWDDNYDRTQFPSLPAGNGAFIIRNSWGGSWGQSGYFYASYYDSVIGSDNAVFINAEATTNYTRVYQYDSYGWVGEVGYGSTTWCANIFTAAATEQLKAAAFYTNDPNASYQLYVYRSVSAGAPRSGTLATSTSGTIANMGYHTVILPASVAVTSGQRFSIVVKLTNPTYAYPIAYEFPAANYSSHASANLGESYFGPDGSYWRDLANWSTGANVCLKGFMGPPDTDADGVPDSLDLCPNSIAGAIVDANGCSNGPGDLDHDGDVDGDDLIIFISCGSGPSVPRTPGCANADFNFDGAVDSADFAVFQRCFSGAGSPSNPACK